MGLAADITLEQVEAGGTLLKPSDYVRKVLARMEGVEREHGPAVLRIGTTGSGQAPHYRFDSHETFQLFDSASHSKLTPLQAFHGRSHDPLPNVPEGEEVDILRESNWSTGFMTFDAVRALLGKVRAPKRRDDSAPA